MKLWTTTETAKLLGISEQTVRNWINQGIVPTSRKARGRGCHNMLNEADVFAIALSRECRRRGMTLNQVRNICDWLMNHPLESLHAQWRRGQVYLFVVGDEVAPVLCSRDMLFNNPDIDLVAAHALGLPVAILNLEGIYQKIVEWIDADRAKHTNPTSLEMAHHEN